LLSPLIDGRADYRQSFPDFNPSRNASSGELATWVWPSFRRDRLLDSVDPERVHAIRPAYLPNYPWMIDRSYYFETSMLAHLYLLGAVVKDVPMPARYQGEGSNRWCIAPRSSFRSNLITYSAGSFRTLSMIFRWRVFICSPVCHFCFSA
jgi:hypothetical protein